MIRVPGTAASVLVLGFLLGGGAVGEKDAVAVALWQVRGVNSGLYSFKSRTVARQAVDCVLRYTGDRRDFWTPLFLLASGDPAAREKDMAERWARSVCYMWMGRERGHAEAIFIGAWGPIGAALARPEEFHMFMNQMLWAYELGRTRDGGLVFLRGGRWTYPVNVTAAMGLFLYLPDKRLRVLGAPKSVFATEPPTPALARAAELFRRKKWGALQNALDPWPGKNGSNRSHETHSLETPAGYAQALRAAFSALEADFQATTALIRQNSAAGKPTTAEQQLDALVQLLGEERPELAELRASLDDGNLKNIPRPEPALAACNRDWADGLGNQKGIDGGFACDPAYIAAMNRRGFEDMAPEAIARFFGHCNGNAAGAAIEAVSAQGRFYLRRGYGAMYAWVYADMNYMRPLFKCQDEFVLHTLRPLGESRGSALGGTARGRQGRGRRAPGGTRRRL